MYPADLRYSETHEWARVEGDAAVVGITHYAQDQLGEVVYLDLPRVDDELSAGELMGSVESVKSISDLYTPVGGTVIEVNEALLEDPAKVNEDPYGAGWMVKIKTSNPADLDRLLSADDYQAKLD